MIINGKSDEYSESFIVDYAKFDKVIRIPELEHVDKESIAKEAKRMNI